jgi:hypothetical protein
MGLRLGSRFVDDLDAPDDRDRQEALPAPESESIDLAGVQESLVVQASRLPRQPGRLHHKTPKLCLDAHRIRLPPRHVAEEQLGPMGWLTAFQTYPPRSLSQREKRGSLNPPACSS